jgi:hypothetical protein
LRNIKGLGASACGDHHRFTQKSASSTHWNSFADNSKVLLYSSFNSGIRGCILSQLWRIHGSSDGAQGKACWAAVLGVFSISFL